MLENYSNNKIKENKYKILRMSLILDSGDNREATINSFEEAAREIDAMNDETYLKEIEGKFYDTLKLEEEEEKLAVLVDYIGGRVEQRISLLSDFANITGYDLSGLAPIKYYDKLDDYKERLKFVREYLSNTDKLNKLTVEIEESEQRLKEAYENKKTSEDYNANNEEVIFNKFVNLIKNIPFLKNITEENIDEKINNIITNVEESKKSLDIFSKSYSTLRGSGISFEEENEYKSYVDNAKEVYYDNKEQEYLLKIYKLLFNKEIEYSHIIIKRETLNEIIYERTELRNELDVSTNDILNPLYEMLERQYKEIEQQKSTIDSIEYLTKLIEVKKKDKKELEEANQKVEILSLLREFCIIDTYEGLETTLGTPDYEEPLSDYMEEDNLDDEETTSSEGGEIVIPTDLFIPSINDAELTPSLEDVKANQVVAVSPATNIDLALVRSKASKVMKRVGEMLGIKVEETTIVSVSNDENAPISNDNSVIDNKITNQEESSTTLNTDVEETSKTEAPTFEFELPNNPLAGENPLFTSNNDVTTTPIVDPEDDNNFWFPSDMPDALNDLPDLEVPASDNFFGNVDIPDLNFPDLKIDFGTNDTEGK